MLNMLKELVGKLSDCGVGRNGGVGVEKRFLRKNEKTFLEVDVCS